MKTYINIAVVSGVEYSNIVRAENYKEALQIQKDRKRRSNNTFKGRLILSQ